MKVRAVKSFGGSKYGHRSAGSIFELPDGVDWLEAGLVEPVETETETASLEAPETAVEKPPKKKRVAKRSGKSKTS